MKKFYFLGLFLMAATLSFGQIDLVVTLDNHNNFDNTSDDPLNMDFTIENVGDSLTDQDTVYFGISVGSSYYTVDNLTQNTVNGVTFQNGFPNGATYQVDVADLTASWLTNALGSSSGLVCGAVLGVGDSVLTTPFSSDATPGDNAECVTWTDASDFGEYDLSQISVYPNPASEDVYFNLGTVDAEQIQILDLSGRVIDVINVNTSIEGLDIRQYQNGIYFYSIIKGDAVLKTSKFVVSK